MNFILTRLFQFDGYEITDIQLSSRKGTIEVLLKRIDGAVRQCYRCGCFLGRKRGFHSRRIEHLPAGNYRCFIRFQQGKGHCTHCGKARNEYVSFTSADTKKYSKDYAEWLGEMCEFAAVSRVSKFNKHNKSTIRDLDYHRLKRLVQSYKIPEVTHISVDEVYGFNTPLAKHKSRDDRFYTIITDLNERKVIWVSEGRSEAALAQFYMLLGPKACKKIAVVAMDQYDGYASATRKYSPEAVIVWDRFHIMKSLEEAINKKERRYTTALKRAIHLSL